MPPRILESELEARVRKYAQSKGALYWKFTSPGTKGVPDRIVVCPNGQVGFLELKRPGEKPRQLQAYWLREISLRRVPAKCADNYEDATTFIDHLCLL